MSSVRKPSLLSDIKDYDPSTDIRVFKNGGNPDCKQSGTMDIFPLKVFYNPDSIANILELIAITSQFIVAMDTNNKPDVVVHNGPDSDLKFYRCHKGIYYLNTSDPKVLNPFVNA